MEIIPAIRSLTTLTQITTLEFGFDFCPSLVNERGQPARIAVLCFRGLTLLGVVWTALDTQKPDVPDASFRFYSSLVLAPGC